MVSAPTVGSLTKPPPLVRLALQLLAWRALLRRPPQWVLGLVRRLRMPPRLRKDNGLAQILVLITRIIGVVSLHSMTLSICSFACTIPLCRLLWSASPRNRGARCSGPGLTDYIDSAVVSPICVSLKCAITTSCVIIDSNCTYRASSLFITESSTSIDRPKHCPESAHQSYN